MYAVGITDSFLVIPCSAGLSSGLRALRLLKEAIHLPILLV